MNFLSRLTGSFSIPAADNPTVAMVEAAYQHHGLDWRYLNCEVPPELLGGAVAGARAMGWAGFNCSLPHKVAVIEHLDGLGQSARLMGAVNCAVARDGQWIGENTDGVGFLTSLKELVDPAGTRVAIFGAGGAARAITVELALAGAEQITVINRGNERGQELTDLLNGPVRQQTGGNFSAAFVPWTGDYAVSSDTDIVINGTSIGLPPNIDARLALDVNSLTESMIVADVIPNPPNTHLLQDASSRGCRVLDGLGMLVNQGVVGINYWSGIRPDARVMRAKLEEIFGA
ncbi:MAG: shikimate dehydrogenase [Pirellulales bacterium]|nr:shikimate dehydrogenase [Pirellulales bacterium]